MSGQCPVFGGPSIGSAEGLAIVDTVSGRDLLIGPVGGRGEAVDHSSGLESRFMGEIASMAAELDIEKADEVVGKVYEKYAERFAEPPAGKPFSECHALTSEYEAEPTEEYMDLFHEILAEIKRYFR